MPLADLGYVGDVDGISGGKHFYADLDKPMTWREVEDLADLLELEPARIDSLCEQDFLYRRLPPPREWELGYWTRSILDNLDYAPGLLFAIRPVVPRPSACVLPWPGDFIQRQRN